MPSLAIKYRPKTFDDVVEQDSVKEILSNICSHNDPKEFTNRNFLLIGPAGTGKAQPLYSKILTPNGYITMADVKIGTQVFTSRGNVAKVSGIYPQGVRPIYEITLQDRTKIRVSDEHLNVVWRYNQSRKQREDYCITTKELIKLFHTLPKGERLRIDVPCVDWSESDVPLDPYLVGALIGDGSLSSGNLGFSNSEEDIVAKIDTILKQDWKYCLKKLPGDNVDYNIVSIYDLHYKFKWSLDDQIFLGSAALKQYLQDIHKPAPSADTLNRWAETKFVNISPAARKKFAYLLNNISVIDSNEYYTQKSQLISTLRSLDMFHKSVDKHIPVCYLYNCRDVRIKLLQGLFDTDGYTDKSGATSWTTSSKQLSDDFSFLVRSLGVRDTIVVETHPSYINSDGERIYSSYAAYTHYLKFPSTLQYFTSHKHEVRHHKRQHEPYRNIVSIRYIGDEECQCIYVDHPDHTYISDNFIPTHNTTQARIMAHMLNGNDDDSNIIEIDAASHNGTDAMRQLIDQAQTYPIGSTYKVFVLDECFTGDTEILTDKGYKRFDSLDQTEKIAQYKDDGSIEFVKPLRYIKRKHKGQIYRLYPKYGDQYVRITPGHIQPVYNYHSDTICEDEIQNTEFKPGDRIILSGRGTGSSEHLTDNERLMIALSADGYISDRLKTSAENKWQVRLVRKDKIERFIYLLKSTNTPWGKNASGPKVEEFWCKTPNTYSKLLSDNFTLSDFSYTKAKEFIEEILHWDGSLKSGYPAYFSSVIRENAELVSAVATLAGYATQIKIHKYENEPTHKTEYQVAMIPCSYGIHFKPHKEIEEFDGEVYCVEVPSHKIIVRAGLFTMISGNCHSLTSQSWQILLKTLEAPPARSVFIFATTNPEKIPATIISRVQTFQLSKISVDGIFNRLKYVMDNEIKEGQQYTYTDDALLYIAKLANGGMRDSLTLLDKALAYNKDITMENIQKSLGLPHYDEYFSLLNAYASKDNVKIAQVVNDVYNSGINFVKWFEGFHSFVIQIVKYILLRDINQTMIPNTYESKLSKYTTAHANMCIKLARKLMELNAKLKTTSYLQETALTYLCFVSTPKKG